MPGEPESPQELTSWKEIADHLHVAVRTAQVWEHEKGLPVRRMTGEKGRLSADPAELDRWKLSVFHNSHRLWGPLYLKVYAVLVTILLLVAVTHEVIYNWGNSPSGSPANFRLEMQSLIVMDQNGNELWRKVFPETIESGAYSVTSMALHRKISFVDLDDDGGLETLFVYAPVNSVRNPSALYCFSSSGEEQWSFAPARASRENVRARGLIHVINDLLVTRSEDNSESKILLLDCQLPGHVAELSVLSARGETMATYSHRGHLGMLEAGDVDGCGVQEILLGGTAEERQQAELIVLSILGEKLREPGRQTTTLHPVRPVRLSEKAIIAFSRTCVNQKLEESNRIALIADTGELLSVGVSELIEDPAIAVTYQLDRSLRPRNVWFSDGLRNLHRSLEAQGVLDHPLTLEEIESYKAVARLEPHLAGIK